MNQQISVFGKYYTPDNLIDEMVKMTPDYFWSKTILEPCAGDGRLVLRILDEKVKRRNV